MWNGEGARKRKNSYLREFLLFTYCSSNRKIYFLENFQYHFVRILFVSFVTVKAYLDPFNFISLSSFFRLFIKLLLSLYVEWGFPYIRFVAKFHKSLGQDCEFHFFFRVYHLPPSLFYHTDFRLLCRRIRTYNGTVKDFVVFGFFFSCSLWFRFALFCVLNYERGWWRRYLVYWADLLGNSEEWNEIRVVLYVYRVFRLNSTPFILHVEQQKLDSCSMGCLSKTLQELHCRHLNFSFSKNLEWFLKNSNLRTKNSRDV